MAEAPVRSEHRDGVAILQLDDGKANALSHEVIDAVHRGLDLAEKEAGSVLLSGRPGRFSAGFHLETLRSGPESMHGLVTAGAELCLRLFELPVPVVAASTGHALAAGALLLLSSDLRIGARGDFKIGLNEVAIGMALPTFGVELARARLSRRHFERAVGQAEIYAPDAAVDAGFLDRAVAPEALADEAFAEASRLAGFSRGAFAGTKARSHAAIAAAIRETLDADIRKMAGLPA